MLLYGGWEEEYPITHRIIARDICPCGHEVEGIRKRHPAIRPFQGPGDLIAFLHGRLTPLYGYHSALFFGTYQLVGKLYQMPRADGETPLKRL